MRIKISNIILGIGLVYCVCWLDGKLVGCHFAVQPQKIYYKPTPLNPSLYKGHGAKTLYWLAKRNITDIQAAIIMAEHGGSMNTTNPGNMVGFHFKSYHAGLIAHKKLLFEGRYKKCFEKKDNALEVISSIQKLGYSPEKEWINVVYAWYMAIHGDNTLLKKYQ